MAVSQQFFTTQEVAELLGKTDGRIRQLCRQHNVGKQFGRARLLTEADVEKLKTIPDRRKKSSE